MSSSSSSSSKKMTSLKSSEGKIFMVEEDVIGSQSQFIKHMIEDGCADAVIPLPNVTSDILVKLIEYCNRHATSPTNYEDEQQLKAFDKTFLEVDYKILFELITAANYLEIKELLDVGCQTVADMIRNKSTEQIRKIFNIENDFTQEEEEEVRSQNPWAYE